jgi:hypothetical protein
MGSGSTCQTAVMESWRRRGGQQVPGPSAGSARLLVAGDTHGNLDWIGTLSKLAKRHECCGVVQLGDFGLWPDQQMARSRGDFTVLDDRWLDAVAQVADFHRVWWRVLDGNHDAHPLARAAYAADTNGVRPIRDGVLDWADRGAAWQWGGVRFAALGGAVSIDKQFRVEGRDWWPTEEITDDDLDSLTARVGDGVDVLLTHDSPELPATIRPLADPVLNDRCRRSVDQVNRAVDIARPSLVLHGHYHCRNVAMLERPWGKVRVEGLASDGEAWAGLSAVILELPSLEVVAL